MSLLRERRAAILLRMHALREVRAEREQELPEPPKPHWSFVLEEMKWMSADFMRERLFKIGAAKKAIKACEKHCDSLRVKHLKDERARESSFRLSARKMSRSVLKFWGKIDQIVVFKQRSHIDRTKRVRRVVRMVLIFVRPRSI